MKKLKAFIVSIIFIATLAMPSTAFMQEKDLEVFFFYSPTCPHCIAEGKFLDEIEPKYPNVKFTRLIASARQNQTLLRKLAKEHDAQRHLGLVPLTFIGDDVFAGFDNKDNFGKQIETSIQKHLESNGEKAPPEEQNKNIRHFPIVGEIDMGKYSLPILAIILGTLDGFNICSLGALVLILGMVLVMQSRKKIMLFGGIFIVTTSVVYGGLIMLWYKLFTVLTPYIRLLEVTVGIIGIIGGIYFYKQFLRYRKYGPTCDTITSESFTGRLTAKVRRAFENPDNLLLLTGSILIFAAVLAIIEFPCSGAIPVMFAGILSEARLSGFSYFGYIALFVLFYMIDEIIVFLIAVYKMEVWMASPKFITWITLIEAIILGALGLFYLSGGL